MTQDEVLKIFRDSGALLEGHFILRSGLHSRQFFQCALALQQMPVVEKLGAALAAKVKSFGAVTVVAPAMGGLVIGQEVARQLGVRFIFVEKEDGKLVLRRGFKIAPGEKILIVEDVVTKGGRVEETIYIVRANGGNVANFEFFGGVAHGSDATHDFVAGNHGIDRVAPFVAGHVQIGVANAAVKSLNSDFSRSRFAAAEGGWRKWGFGVGCSVTFG